MKPSRHLYILVFSIYLAAVLFLCLVKTDDLPEVKDSFLGLPMDKIMHFLMFLPFVVLGSLSFMKKDNNVRTILITILLLSVVGIGIAAGTEQLQAMTGYRTCDIKDFYTDIAGILAGSVITLLLFYRDKNLKRQ